MAKALKFFYEFKDIDEVLHRVEIHVEGYVGSAIELQAGVQPFVENKNKDVAEQYLGGIVQTNYTYQAVTSSQFNADALTSENYGDVVVIKKTAGTIVSEGILAPFQSKDADLPEGLSVTSFQSECGLAFLKGETYAHTTTRLKLIQVLHKCLQVIPTINDYPYSIIDNTRVSIDGTVNTGKWALYWDSFVNEFYFKDKSCYEVIEEILQPYNDLRFANGKWCIVNIPEINATDSFELTYNNAGVYVSSAAYARPSNGSPIRLNGMFGRNFSFKNITIEKEKTRSLELFPIGEMDSSTGWTANGTIENLLFFQDGFLKNGGSVVVNPSGVDANFYESTNPISFYPFLISNAEGLESDKITIALKAINGGRIKNLRIQIIATQVDINKKFYLNSDGSWYSEISGVGTPIYQVKPSPNEIKIDIPRPPYVPSNINIFSSILGNQNGFFEDGFGLFPDTNPEYRLTIRIYRPESTVAYASNNAMLYNSDIDYLRVNVVKLNDEGFEGFVKTFGVETYADRQNKLALNVSLGYPMHPYGSETLYLASTGNDFVQSIAPYTGGIVWLFQNIVEHTSYLYLQTLSRRLRTWEGTLFGAFNPNELLSIDGTLMRVHNYSYDARTTQTRVKCIEVSAPLAITTAEEEPKLDKATAVAINKAISDVLRTGLGRRFTQVSENWNSNIVDGQLVLSESKVPRYDNVTLRTGEVFLLAEGNTNTGTKWIDGDGVVTDYIIKTTNGFEFKSEDNANTATLDFSNLTQNVILSVPNLAVNSVIATDATAWMRGATNALTAKDFIGSVSGNFDLGIKRNNVEIVTVKSSGIDVTGRITAATAAITGLTTNYLPKVGAAGLLGDSQIFDNGTNIGFRTVTPTERFEFITDVGIVVRQNQTADTNSTTRWYGGTYGTNKSTILVQTATSTNNQLIFGGGTGGGEAATIIDFNIGSVGVLGGGNNILRINSGGLEVNGTTRTTNLKINNGAAVGRVWQCTNADGTGAWVTPLASERYKGEYDANSGVAPAASPTTGDYYVVNNGGTYSGVTYVAGDEIYWDGTNWIKRSNFLTLPIATASTLGGIKVGSRLSIASGVLSADVAAWADITGKPTTLAGYNLDDDITTILGDYVDRSTDQGINGVKTFSGQVRLQDTVFLNNEITVADITLRYLQAGGGTHDVWTIYNHREFNTDKFLWFMNETTAGSPLKLYGDGKALIDKLVTGSDVTYGDESANINGSIKYEGTLKPLGVSPTVGQFLKANTTSTNVWANIAISDVTDLTTQLAGKAATVHTHTIAQITDLQTALDGKAATVHTHTFASLTSKPTTIAGYGITDFNALWQEQMGTKVTSYSVNMIPRISNTAAGGQPVDYKLQPSGMSYDTAWGFPKINIPFANITSGNITSSLQFDGMLHSTANNATNQVAGDVLVSRGHGTGSAYAPIWRKLVISDVTDLTTQLAGKAATVHNHTVSQITDFSTGWDARLATKTTTNLAEGTNLYFTNARSRSAISLTTANSSGAATYNNATGVFNIPNYTLAGLGGEPIFSKNAAFNKNFGTTAGTVAEGNHTHTVSQITDIATNYWKYGGNALTAKTLLGSTAAFDLGIIRNSVEIVTVKSSGIDVTGRVTAATAAITGLTTNYLPKVGAAGLLGDSQIFDNGTNIGIGTVAPVNKLDIIGNGFGFKDSQAANINKNTRIYGGAYSTNNLTLLVSVGTVSSNTIFVGGGTGGGEAATVIAFNTSPSVGTVGSGTERMRIHGSGNVGIGTTVDSGDRLNIVGTIRTSSIINQFVKANASGVLMGSAIAISDVTDLTTQLADKAATVHTHTIAQVTDLQTTLDGKAPLGHVHQISDIVSLQPILTNLQNDLNLKWNTSDFQFSISDGLGGTRDLYGLRTKDVDGSFNGFLGFDQTSGALMLEANTFEGASVHQVASDGFWYRSFNNATPERYALLSEVNTATGGTLQNLQQVTDVGFTTNKRIKFQESVSGFYDFALQSDTTRLNYRPGNNQPAINYALVTELGTAGETPTLDLVTTAGNLTTKDIRFRNVSDADLTGVIFANSSDANVSSIVHYQGANNFLEIKSLNNLKVIATNEIAIETPQTIWISSDATVNISAVGGVNLDTQEVISLMGSLFKFDVDPNNVHPVGTQFVLEKVSEPSTLYPQAKYRFVVIN